MARVLLLEVASSLQDSLYVVYVNASLLCVSHRHVGILRCFVFLKLGFWSYCDVGFEDLDGSWVYIFHHSNLGIY